jgi:CheY-like chemotaxis protein
VPASSGRQALEVLGTGQIDAVLTDLQMPEMDGLTMLGHFVERGIQLPIAVMTGQMIEPELSRRLHAHGIAAVFSKPVDVGTLADELQRALDPATVGRISGITLFGFLQLLEVERKSGLVLVRSGGDEGRLYFEAGALVHAHVRRLTGVEAAHEILRWPDPTVEIFYRRRPRQRTVTEPLQHVLMETARRMDEGDRRDTGSARAKAASAVPADGWSAGFAHTGESVQAALDAACDIRGALAAALVHVRSGLTLSHAGGDATFPVELASAAAADVVGAQVRGMDALKLGDRLEDFMITLGSQYHLIRLLEPTHETFLYLVLDRARGNLGMARQQLADIALRMNAERSTR